MHGNLAFDWCTEDILRLELVEIISESKPENRSDVDEDDNENCLSDTEWLSESESGDETADLSQ